MLADAVNAVRDIGGNKLGGILYSAHTKYGRAPSERGWKNSAAAIAKTAKLAKAAGVDLVLELVNRFESNLLNTTAQGLKFLKDTGSDHVRLHLDTFHMNIEEANPAAAIRLAGDKIGYFHVGESNRGYLGDGVIDFDRHLRRAAGHRLSARHRLRELLHQSGRRRSVLGLRNLARCLDRQSTVSRARQEVHRREIRRGRAPSRQQCQSLNFTIRSADAAIELVENAIGNFRGGYRLFAWTTAFACSLSGNSGATRRMREKPRRSRKTRSADRRECEASAYRSRMASLCAARVEALRAE